MLSSTNVSFNAVKAELGVTVGSLEELCMSDKINRWARYSALTAGGVFIPMSPTPANAPFSAIALGWTNVLPTTEIGYRLGRFGRYEHKAIVPYSLNFPEYVYNSKPNVFSIDIKTVAGTNITFPEVMKTDSRYLCVAVRLKNNPSVQMWTTAQELGATSVTLDLSSFPVGSTVECGFLYSSQKFTNASTTLGATFYAIGNTSEIVAMKEYVVKSSYEPDKTYIVSTFDSNKGMSVDTYINGVTHIDWGDGVAQAISGGVIKHTYAKAGLYNIVITHTNTAELKLADFKPKEALSVGKLLSCVELFSMCEYLDTLSPTMFKNCTSVREFSMCFGMCSSLSEIPEDIFWDCNEILDISACFAMTSITHIPPLLFKTLTKCQGFIQAFMMCPSLTSVPAGLFDTCTNAENFFWCFRECTSLDTIPDFLFSNCTKASVFNMCFAHCPIKRLPVNIFKNCVSADDMKWCFQGTKIVSIPIGVLKDCVNVTECNGMFYGSTVGMLGAGLLDTCVNLRDVSNMFYDCKNIVNTYNCTSSGLPKLWERDGTNGAVRITSYVGFATGASDAFKNSVPVDWT